MSSVACAKCGTWLCPSALSGHQRRYHRGEELRLPCPDCAFASPALVDALAHRLLEGHALRLRPSEDHCSADALASNLSTHSGQEQAADGSHRQENFNLPEPVSPLEKIEKPDACGETWCPTEKDMSQGSVEHAAFKWPTQPNQDNSKGIRPVSSLRKRRNVLKKSEKLSLKTGKESTETSKNMAKSTAPSPMKDEEREKPKVFHLDAPADKALCWQPKSAAGRVVEFSAFALPSPTAATDPSRLDQLTELSASEYAQRGSDSISADKSAELSTPDDTECQDNAADAHEHNLCGCPHHSSDSEAEDSAVPEGKPVSGARQKQKRGLSAQKPPAFSTQCCKCGATMQNTDVRSRASAMLGHAKACFAIKPFACSGCGWHATRRDNLQGHIRARCPGASVVLMNREENEVAVRAALRACFPDRILRFRGFQSSADSSTSSAA